MKKWALAAVFWAGPGLAPALVFADEDIPAELTSAFDVDDVAGLQSWEAPGECIFLTDLRRKVAAQSTSDQRELRSVEGQVQTSDSGWAVTLTVYEGDVRLGERVLELQGEDCRAHDETLALVIALLLEHGPAPPDDSKQPESKPTPPESAPPESADLLGDESPDAPVDPPAKHPDETMRGRAGLGVRALSGLAPSLAWGPTVFGGVTLLDYWALDLQGDFYTRDTEQLPSGGQVVAWGGRVHARACAMPAVGKVRVSACPGVGWIILEATGREVMEPRSAVFRSAEVGAEMGILGKILGPVSFLLEGGLLVPLRQGRFVLTSPEGFVEVHETAATFTTGSLSLLLTL